MTADVKNLKGMLDGNATDVSIDLDTELLTSDLKGTLALGPKPAFDFSFDGEVPSAPALADAFKVADLPARAVLGKITAKGQALGTPEDITLKIGSARHESPLLNADFKGDVRIAQFITLAIDASAEAPQLAELARAMSIEAPAPTALGKTTATTKIAGQLGDLKFNDVKFRHEGGLLDMTFDGSAALKADLTYDGHLSIRAADLRKLAEAAGSKLPEGNIYRSFSFSGDTSGGVRNVFLTNAVVQFDDIRGKGEAALTFGDKPKLIGTLTTNAIDVTPYATASGAPKDPSAGVWGDTPIDLTPLKLADANLSIRAAGVKFQQFVFGESNLSLKVENGKLTADLKQTELFGGKGNVVLVADGTAAVPAVTLSADIDKLALQPLLRAAADFDMMDGKGDLKMNVVGSGANLQALMSSLAGNGTFVFADGVIKGVDLPELVKQAPNALKNRTIPISAFGTARNTKFDTLNGSFAMKDGVAVMPDMKMDAGVMTVTGGGALDIGRQRTSLSLYPEFKNKNDGIKGYGLPMKLEGTWAKVDLSLDYEWLIQRAASDVRARVETEIRDELEKQLGGRLGGILGQRSGTQPAPAGNPAPAPAQQAAPPASEAPPPAEEKPEDRAKREINRALGNLFGN
jgi:AsmA protein